MDNNKSRSVYVIGHKNPDTDSICSAIAYAELKNILFGHGYEAKRAGEINPETRYVLDYFNIEPPEYIEDVRPKVEDIEIRAYDVVDKELSLKEAWALMVEKNVVTLPVVFNKKLEGVITLGDITMAYMDVFDSKIIASASTSYRNIVETLDGEMVVGNIGDHITEGKVLIAAANPDLMENYINKRDIVILGNRYESQLCAIEMEAQCIIVCDGAPVSKTITRLASERGCQIIRTSYDTYTVARLVNQSMPIGYFMCNENLIVFTKDDYIDDIRDVMAKKRYRDFPVLDKDGCFFGMISRRNLLDAKKRKIILMDHNERNQAVDGLEDAELLEIIDHHRLGTMETMNPVYFRNQPVGCTSTIVYQMYQENGIEIKSEIAGLLCAAILSDTLAFRSPTCTPADMNAAKKLGEMAGIECHAFAIDMFKAGSNLTNKTAEAIFYQDFKRFQVGDLEFGVGQIIAMTSEEMSIIKEKLVPYMNEAFHNHKLSVMFFMLTNIIEESTELLYEGEQAAELIKRAFHVSVGNKEVILNGVVSRKKQLIPTIMKAIRENEI